MRLIEVCLIAAILVLLSWLVAGCECEILHDEDEFNAYCYEQQILELEQWIADTSIPEYRIFLEHVLLQTKLVWGDNSSDFTFKEYSKLKESLYED